MTHKNVEKAWTRGPRARGHLSALNKCIYEIVSIKSSGLFAATGVYVNSVSFINSTILCWESGPGPFHTRPPKTLKILSHKCKLFVFCIVFFYFWHEMKVNFSFEIGSVSYLWTNRIFCIYEYLSYWVKTVFYIIIFLLNNKSNINKMKKTEKNFLLI